MFYFYRRNYICKEWQCDYKNHEAGERISEHNLDKAQGVSDTFVNCRCQCCAEWRQCFHCRQPVNTARIWRLSGKLPPSCQGKNLPWYSGLLFCRVSDPRQTAPIVVFAQNMAARGARLFRAHAKNIIVVFLWTQVSEFPTNDHWRGSLTTT